MQFNPFASVIFAMMFRVSIIAAFVLCVFQSFWSQGNGKGVPEIGFIAGGSYYTGDLNRFKHFNNTHFSGGMFYRNQLKGNERVSFRAHLHYGKVSADDSESQDEQIQARNLNFRSRIIEAGGAFEFHFLKYEIGSKLKPGTPYLFLGMNYMKMNPQGQYEDGWVSLQPLGTEGQGSSLNSNNRYRLSQIVIPFGAGLKVNLSKRVALGCEFGFRKLFTDYFDDVSGVYVDAVQLSRENGQLSAALSNQSTDPSVGTVGQNRGNPNNKDWYYTFGASISFRLFERTTCWNP